MMKNRGFTLIELLGVIVILGVIAAFSVPAVTKMLKETSDKEYEEFAKSITLAAENYFHNETDGVLNTKRFIKVEQLISSGYLKKTINPLTNEKLSNSSTIVVSKNSNGTEKYEFVDKDLTIDGYVKNNLTVLYDGYNKPANNIWTDLSGNGNDGVLTNFSSPWDNNGIQFDGIDDYIKTTQVSNFPSGNSQYTLEISFYCDTLKERNNLINLGIYESAGNANGIYIYESNKISHWYWNNNLVTSPLLENKRGYTITALYDGKNRKIYLNGKQRALDAVSPNVVLGNVTIGDEIPGQDGYFNGKVYSVRIYNRGLTDSEVYENYIIDKYRFDI